jgi:hypothetical protein
MDLQFNIESVAEVRGDLEDLIIAHYEELTANKDVVQLAPDYERYQQLEDMGKLAIFTVRDMPNLNDGTIPGKLVGYSIFFIDQHIHYRNQSFANNDIIFLHQDYRNPFTWRRWLLSWTRRLLVIPKRTKGIGEQLIDFSEEQLRLMCVTKVIWHIKFKLNWFPILKRRGYAREDFTVGKIL